MSNKKVILISANRHIVPYPVYPLGIAYLLTYLEEKLPEFEFRLFDFNMNNRQDLINTLQEFKPDYAGVSFRNVDDVNYSVQESFFSEYQEIIDTTKKNSSAKIIIGGAGFSIFPELFFKKLRPDFGIFGEGEESLYKLLVSLEDNLDFSTIEGLLFNQGSELVINERTNYFKKPGLEFNDKLVDYYWDKSGMLNIQTKRGCPYKCVYCTYPVIEGRTVRTLNADKIVETLSKLYHERKINYVFFTDSVFNISNDFNIELAQKIIDSKIKMRWGAYFSPHDLDVETLRFYKAAGLKHIEFGTESISDTTLENYGKHFGVKDILEVSDNCRKAGVYYAHFLILAGIGETDKTVDETFENSKKISNSVFFPYIGMRIYPGTRLHGKAIEERFISKTDELLKPTYYVSKDVTIDTLKIRAAKTGQAWVFTDDDVSEIVDLMRKKKRKGPLWHLIRP